ncbi:MAG: hypothetical protein AAGD38_19790 [Acidobacteriota bacterium]
MIRKILVLAAVLTIVPAMASANSLAVNGTAAIVGSFGMEVNYDGAASLAYVQSDHMTDETGVRITFRIDAGGPTANPGQFDFAGFPANIRIMTLVEQGQGSRVVLFLKPGTSADTWRMAAFVRTDAGPFTFGGEGFLGGNGADSSVTVVLEWAAATGAGNNDGRIFASKTNANGVTTTMFERNDIDNDTHNLDIMRFGSPSTNEVGTPSGSVYLDEVVIERL